MPLDPPDGAETGAGPAATAYTKLAACTLNHEETCLANFLREVYRRAYPLNTGLPMVTGGSMVFCGPNIRVMDDGTYYRLWQGKSGLTVRPRTGRLSGSSHQSDADQYEIQLRDAGVILVGMSNNYPGLAARHTWLQNEAHAANAGWGQWALHGMDFGFHVGSGYQQVGAFGYSEYSEKDIPDGRVMSGRTRNPLVLTDLPAYRF